MDPFIGQIIIFGGNYAPQGWAFCDGRMMAISDYPALYSILGTTYGGDGRANFALPDLRGRVPVQQGQAPGLSPHLLGETGGAESVALSADQMPTHNHAATGTLSVCNGSGERSRASRCSLTAGSGGGAGPVSVDEDTDVRDGTVSVSVESAGNSMPHTNMQPYLSINFIIALEGEYPLRW